MPHTVVSAQAEEAIQLLVCWELLGAVDVDPKQVLREVSIWDLYIVKENIMLTGEGDFLSTKLVELEVMYRDGLLREDWALSQEGEHVSIRYSPLRQGLPVHLDVITMGGLG